MLKMLFMWVLVFIVAMPKPGGHGGPASLITDAILIPVILWLAWPSIRTITGEPTVRGVIIGFTVIGTAIVFGVIRDTYLGQHTPRNNYHYTSEQSHQAANKP